MSEWKEVKIDDISSILGDGLHGTPIYNENGQYYFINGNNLENGNIVIKKDTKRVGEEEYQKYKKDLNDRTLFVSINGTVGNIAKYAGEQCILGKSACYFNVIENVNRDFIYYIIASPRFQNAISGLATGTTIKNVSLKTMREYSFMLPDLPTQQRIASILSSLDAKIENNNKINAKLEEIAQNLFKEWFVDFGPFKNGKFVESELGLIPEGWRVGTLREIADNITDGVHNSVEDDENSAYYLLSCKNIKGGTLSIDNKDRKISQSTFLQLRKRTKLAKGDILVSSVGTIGEVMLLNEDPHNYEFQRSVAIIKPLANVSTSEFIYETLKVKNIELKHLAHGAVQQCIFISDLSGFKIVIPPCSIVDTFSEKTKSLFEIIALNNKQNTKLATLRDTLLPKLMSGEIEV